MKNYLFYTLILVFACKQKQSSTETTSTPIDKARIDTLAIDNWRDVFDSIGAVMYTINILKLILVA